MNKDALMVILERAAEDITFYSQLAEDYAEVLKDYDLSWEERTALITGDVRWIESSIGRKLDNQVRMKVMIPLLSRENW